MGEADRARYQREVLALAQKLEGPDGGTEENVWQVYAATEKLIAVLKFRLDYETPGVFAKLPDAADPAKLVRAAGSLLSRAGTEIELAEMVTAIETLRKARNNLRSYLKDKRKTVSERSRSRVSTRRKVKGS